MSFSESSSLLSSLSELSQCSVPALRGTNSEQCQVMPPKCWVCPQARCCALRKVKIKVGEENIEQN